MPIDLHTHSTVSDGTMSPAQVIEAAGAAGLSTVALTDHDTFGGWDEATGAAQRVGIDLIRGVEISCQHQGISIHLLGYLLDPTDAALTRELELARESRVTRLQRIVEAMAEDGIPITMADVMAQVESADTTLGRPHIADALIAAGVVPDRNTAFADYLHNSSRYYRSHYAPDPVTATRLVRDAGGVPVMAHPFAAARGRVVADGVIEEMARAGLVGLEADHRDHTDDQRAHARDLAAGLGLFVTGSSDFHGSGKPNQLGENTTAPTVLSQIIDQSSGVTPVVRGRS